MRDNEFLWKNCKTFCTNSETSKRRFNYSQCIRMIILMIFSSIRNSSMYETCITCKKNHFPYVRIQKYCRSENIRKFIDVWLRSIEKMFYSFSKSVKKNDLITIDCTRIWDDRHFPRVSVYGMRASEKITIYHWKGKNHIQWEKW